MSEPATGLALRRIATSADLVLAFPNCEKSIGKVITSPSSPDLIDGVKVEPMPLWADDRGYFMEIQRLSKGLAAHFPPNSTQISAAINYPGPVKAFHYHLHQTDLWLTVKGMVQAALVDLRAGSPTFGARNTLYVGALRMWQILIPPGVGHGYKVIGTDDAVLVYLTNRFYDPKDEGRIAYNDPSINYDWETQHK